MTSCAGIAVLAAGHAELTLKTQQSNSNTPNQINKGILLAMNGFALSDGSLLAQPSTAGLVPQFEKTYETRQKTYKRHDFLDLKNVKT